MGGKHPKLQRISKYSSAWLLNHLFSYYGGTYYIMRDKTLHRVAHDPSGDSLLKPKTIHHQPDTHFLLCGTITNSLQLWRSCKDATPLTLAWRSPWW